MQNLTIAQTLTMSSREIAELVGKNHKEVCRDIRVMLVALYGGNESDYIRSANLLYHTNQGVSCSQYDTTNPNGWEYLLDRRHTEILITGYDVKRRAAVIDRWFAIESGKAQAITAAPTLPENYISALEALLESKKSEATLASYAHFWCTGFRRGWRILLIDFVDDFNNREMIRHEKVYPTGLRRTRYCR